MKSSLILASLLALAASALPTPDASPQTPSALTARGINLRDLHSLSKRYTGGDTANDLSGPCKPVTVIFARGTTEPGNVGLLAGPPFFSALNTRLGASNVAVQGVDYAASIPGYLEGGDPAGASTMASLATQAASKCPSTQIVLSGYSQGAQVVHLAAPQISSMIKTNLVKAVILFGDPDDNQPLSGISASKVDTFCAPGDLICDGEPIILPAHLSYGVDAGAAAEFVAARVSV